jgi:hypothetical protein
VGEEQELGQGQGMQAKETGLGQVSRPLEVTEMSYILMSVMALPLSKWVRELGGE